MTIIFTKKNNEIELLLFVTHFLFLIKLNLICGKLKAKIIFYINSDYLSYC